MPDNSVSENTQLAKNVDSGRSNALSSPPPATNTADVELARLEKSPQNDVQLIQKELTRVLSEGHKKLEETLKEHGTSLGLFARGAISSDRRDSINTFLQHLPESMNALDQISKTLDDFSAKVTSGSVPPAKFISAATQVITKGEDLLKTAGTLEGNGKELNRLELASYINGLNPQTITPIASIHQTLNAVASQFRQACDTSSTG